MRNLIQRFPTLCIILFALFLVSGCVPSPTATPPRQTPFPTLPFVDGTETPGAPLGLGTPVAATSIPTFAPPTVVPIPTNAPSSVDTLPPIVQLTVQDPEQPVSADKTVPLNVLAADNNIITRLEMYDNNMLFAQAPVVLPAAVYSNQFTWKANGLGKHILSAIAYDAHGNASEPAQIELAVINNNRAPAILILSPSGSKNAELGTPIMVQAVATDDVAVTRMDLIVDNQLVTFAAPDNPGGVTPFAVALPWTPTSTGSHNIVLRAYDNQGQSDDSLRYSVQVFDNQPPVVTAQSEYNTLPPGDVLLVNALALSNNGIGRVELYVDERLTDGVNSPLPSQQTAMQVTLSAADLINGTHSFYVRAYDVTGQSTDTPRGTVEVSADAPRVVRANGTPPPTRTPFPPTPTPTPQLVLPVPPTIELELANAPVVLPGAAQIRILARGSSELDHMELWGRGPGETSAQLLMDENVQGTTEKTLTFEWQAPRAGVVEMFARVTDNLKQAQLSVPLRFNVQAPRVPTPPPAVYDFAQAWAAESPAARFQINFTQTGRALRGTMVEQLADGRIVNGTIVSGAVNEKSVLFGVELASEGAQGGTPQATLEFDCSFNPRPPALTCNYTNEKGERGSVIFEPLAP